MFMSSSWSMGSCNTVMTPGFRIVTESIFDIDKIGCTDAIVNSVNCVGVMGAGIALEFKKRYPSMYNDYKVACQAKMLRPGHCHVYYDVVDTLYILNLAVKNDWRNWSTMEWLLDSIKSLKLAILENDIQSVNLPVIGGMNGRRGPNGKILNMTPPPEKDNIIELLRMELQPFAIKFKIDIRLCMPEKKVVKEQPTLSEFLV
jgi:hypothetical protein